MRRASAAMGLLTALALLAGAARAELPKPPAETAQLPVMLLVDLGSGQVLAARRPDLSFVPASVTKVMTVAVALREIEAGRLAPDRTFTVSPQTAARWSGKGTSLYVKAGDRLSADTLLHAIATVSANDASIVLAEGYAGSVARWAALMNAEARRLGMTHSRYATPNGWPDGGRTYVSAGDLVRLSRELLVRHRVGYHRYFGQRRMTWGGRTQQSHDPVTGVVAGADGIKTGFTREAGYNFLGSAERDGRRLVMVVAGAKSEAERAAASRALLEWGFSAWQKRALFGAGEVVASARVQQGDARRVPLRAPAAIHASIPAGTRPGIRLRVVYKGPLVAPVAKGAHVADLEIAVAGMAPSRVPLVAGKAVGTAGPFDRLLNGLMGLLS